MMPLFKRANTKPVTTSSVQWENQTLTRMEQLARQYGRNPEFQAYLDHAQGLVHNCAVMNADACSAGVLKLYKRAGAANGTRSARYRGRGVGSTKSLDMKRGRYGHKLAEFTAGGAEMVEVVNHPILDFISNPNPMFPGAELWALSWYQRWIGGNSYEWINDESGVMQALPLYAQFVQAYMPEGGDGIEYMYSRSNEEVGRYTQDEVLHSRLRASPHSPLYGMGALQGSLPYADLIQDSVLYDISLAKNGMRPDYIVQVPELTSDPEVEKMERRFKSKLTGVANWVKPLFIKGDVKVLPLSINEKELMSLPKREEANKIIRQSFGHTESMNDSNDSTYASAMIGYDTQFLGGTIEPALARDAAQKNAGLLPMFNLDPNAYCFAYEPLVTKDEAKVEERVRLNVQSGIITINEARSELGLEDSDQENADMLLVNGQLPGAAAAPDPFAGLLGGFSQQPKDEPKEEADEEPAPPGSAEESEIGEPEEKAFDQSAFVKSILEHESVMYKPCPGCRQTKDDDDIAADPTLKEALRRFEGKVEGVARTIVTDMQDEAVSAYGAGREPDLINLRSQSAGLLKSTMQEIVEFGVLNILESNEGPLGAISVPQEAFDLVPERALKFLENYTIELADDLAKTTAEMSKRAVEVGLENGLSIDKIAKQIEGVPEHRAKLIARMETSRAVQHGKREGMIAIDIEEHKVITATGARPEHVEIASQGAIPIDQPFVKAGQTIGDETYPRDMYAPPFWFGCRCAVVPVFD